MKKNQEQSKDSAKLAEAQSSIKTTQGNSKETIQTMDQEDKIELERREAYIDPKTRDLLRKLLQDGDKEEITPIYTSSSGFIYPITGTTPIGNGTDNISRELLENLAKLSILQKNFYDSVSVCPSCQSTIITLHNRCPRCKSHNVDKTSLTEHIPCGYIDQRSKYTQDRCPKCGQPLFEGQYRNMGRWYVCRDCGERFENPELDLICHNCNKNFTIKEAQLVEIPKFSLNLARKKEIRQNVASLENIRELLADLGFSVEIPGLSIGQKSGIQHHFSLIAKKQVNGLEIVIALDHAISESEVSSSPLILYIYKTSEVKVDIPVFVAMPKLNETAKKIAQGHEILLIEGSTEDKDAMEKIKKDIEFKIELKLIEAEVAKKKAEMKRETKTFMGKLTGLKLRKAP
jgi:ssDNA-binding Zn-finger/Zn-ribbon topoisomerase 1